MKIFSYDASASQWKKPNGFDCAHTRDAVVCVVDVDVRREQKI